MSHQHLFLPRVAWCVSVSALVVAIVSSSVAGCPPRSPRRRLCGVLLFSPVILFFTRLTSVVYTSTHTTSHGKLITSTRTNLQRDGYPHSSLARSIEAVWAGRFQFVACPYPPSNGPERILNHRHHQLPRRNVLLQKIIIPPHQITDLLRADFSEQL